MHTTSIGLAIVHSGAYYRGALRGVRRYAEAKPHWVFTSLVAEPPSRSRLGHRRPDGIVAAVNTPALARSLKSLRCPVVNVSAVLRHVNLPRVGVDNSLVGRLAADHFLTRQLRHFAFLGPDNQLFSIERRAAFCREIERVGCVVHCYDVHPDRPFDPLGRWPNLGPAVGRWLQGLPKPSGLFVPNDLWGVQISEACRQAGLRVPEDVALLGVDNDDLYCELTRPPLSSIIIPSDRIGYEAASLLARLLNGGRRPAEPLLLPPAGIVARRSTDILASDDPVVVSAVRFVRDHAHLPLQITDVTKHLSVGRRTLERRCQHALGHSLGDEIRRSHLERACRLLAETDISIEALAHQAGYSNARHMGAVFRKDLGLSPTGYRRQQRGQSS